MRAHWSPAQIGTRYTNKKEIAKVPIKVISNAKHTFDCCINQFVVHLITENEELWAAIKALKYRGVRARFVTNISEENILYILLVEVN